jgi:cystathionine beta-lyase/cystathionine gamma-synthase
MTMAPSSVFLPTLPGRYYTDAAVFEREMQNIFSRQWMYVCRAEDVPAPHRAGALLVVDGTFASPFLQQPIALGADLVIHSTTKYLGGHSDITGGAIIAAEAGTGATISRYVGMLGTAAAPQEAWLAQRGIKTLPARMRQICASSQRIAEFLAAHPAVRRVHYPGLSIGLEDCDELIADLGQALAG